MADDKDADPSAALLGVPTGESLSRDGVDDLEFSAKQQKRPKGMSRADYMRSGPGMETRTLMAMAGVTRGRRIAIVIVTSLLLGAAGALVWYLVLES